MLLKQQQKPIASSGLTKAVCVDYVELGLQDTAYGAKTKVEFVWEVDEKHPEYDQRLTVNKRYNVSMHKDSSLRQDLESWIGRGLTQKELTDGIDAEKFIGKGAMLNVVHNTSGDRTYANVKSVMPMVKGETFAPYGNYTRVKDRENSWDERTKQKEWEASNDGAEAEVEEDFSNAGSTDGLPF